MKVVLVYQRDAVEKTVKEVTLSSTKALGEFCYIYQPLKVIAVRMEEK